MTRSRVLALLGILLILILGGAAGAWWYLFGPVAVDAAELVPADTVFYATIPNAANIAAGYQGSQLKQLVDAPNAKPAIDSILNAIGQKNIDVLNAFLPNLSGQSFFAITHFDSENLAQTGIIAGLKPKAGIGSFDAFIAKLKETYPTVLGTSTNGTGNVAGVDYQWIKGPSASDKICVAKINGWIITSWGEASLQDWIERFHKKSVTPSLKSNADYQKALAGVGNDSMTLVYVNYHTVLDLIQKQIAKTNPNGGDYLAKRFGTVGGMALGTRFENGQIVDRFSCLLPKQAQIDSGMAATPCAFETLKFTGPTTKIYWAFNANWQQYIKNLQEQPSMSPTPNPMMAMVVPQLQALAKGVGIDLQHNIIDALGDEASLQVEWQDDQTYPEVGFFIKIAKPDDFKPALTAFVEGVRLAYQNSAVMTELDAKGEKLAALTFIQAAPVTPTVTETVSAAQPYFGIFTTKGLAARAFTEDETVTLVHNPNFSSQIGDKRNGASQIIFVDTPHLLDHAYKTAVPYLSLASMFNKDLAALLQGKQLPPDLTWLSPIGTWSFVMTPDADSIRGYSISGVGNQGILMAFAAGGAVGAAQMLGVIPKATGAPKTPAIPTTPSPSPAPTPTPAPTNAAPADASGTTTTTAAPAAPDANATTAPAATPNTTPATNADQATSPTPDASKPQ